MDPIVRNACLNEIRQLWSKAYQRPEMIWIAEHEAIAPTSDNANTNVLNAWFLTYHGLERRAAHDYVRFLTVHSGFYWFSGSTAPPASGVFNNRPGHGHTIGMASFAPVAGTDLIYVEYLWGGLNGRGSRFRFQQQNATLECVENVWLS